MDDDFLAQLSAAPTARRSYATAGDGRELDSAPGTTDPNLDGCVRSRHSVLVAAFADGTFAFRTSRLVSPATGGESLPLTETDFGLDLAAVAGVIGGEGDLSLKIRRVAGHDWLVIGEYDRGSKRFATVRAKCRLAPSVPIRAIEVAVLVETMRREWDIDNVRDDVARRPLARLRALFGRH